MSIEVEDSEFQRILLDSISEARGPVDDAALARLLQLQEDALVQTNKAPTSMNAHFGNAGAPSNPIVVCDEDEEELRYAVEESLKLNRGREANTSHLPGSGSEKNPLNTATQPFLPFHQNISSTHPSSTPSTQFPTSTLPSPRATTSSYSSPSSSVDGLIPMIGSLRISPSNERAKNNKPIINTTFTSTTRNTNYSDANKPNNNNTNTNTNANGNSGNIGTTTTNTSTSTELSDITSTSTNTNNNNNDNVRKILRPRSSKQTPSKSAQKTANPNPTPAPNPPSINPSSLTPTPYPNPTSPTPQNSQPPPRANSNNANPALFPPPTSSASSLLLSRPYGYTTYHTTPTNNSVNIAADLSTPFNSISTSTNTNSVPFSTSAIPSTSANSVPFNTSTIPFTSTNNINNMYHIINHTQQRQQHLPSGRIPPTSTLFNSPAIPSTSTSNSNAIPYNTPSIPSATVVNNNSNNSNIPTPLSRIPPTSRLLANPSSTPPSASATPSIPTTLSTAINPPHPPSTSPYPPNPSPSLPQVYYQPPHRQPQQRLPVFNQPISSAGNAGNARRPVYVSYGGRVGSLNEPPLGDSTAFEDDEALAQRLQLQEAMQLQQEYDQRNSPGFHSHRSNFHEDTVAQLLRYQELMERRSQGYHYSEGDSGSDFSDEEYEDEHDVDHMTYEQLLALEDRMGHVPRGASKSEIEVCPKFTLTSDHSLENKTCLVCHDEMAVGNEIRRLPCLHMYHASCIDTWLSQKPTCPVCLYTIKKD